MPKTAAERKRHGQHYTPQGLADFLALRIVDNLHPTTDTIAVLDPACGDGELLFAFHRAAAKRWPATRVLLHGFDIDADAIRVAKERATEADIEVSLAERDFLSESDTIVDGTFDAIITNPPYVRTQQLGYETAQMLSTKFGLVGRIDLTHPFVSIAPNVLNKSGVLGLLSSNRFLTTRAGVNVRKTLASTMNTVEIYDLGDTKLFSAAVLPAITIAKNEQPSNQECVFVSAYETQSETTTDNDDLFSVIDLREDAVAKHDGRAIEVRSGLLAQGENATAPWRMVHQDRESWLNTLASSTWKTFGEVAKIRVGIKTTADPVFISDSWDELAAPPEDALLLPLITHHNVSAWSVSAELATRVLYPYDLSAPRRSVVDMNEFPNAMTYLEEHSQRLKGRKYVTDSGREWFEIWVPQKPQLWETPKIVFPDISELPRFAYDTSGAVVNGDCYWISLADIGDEDLAALMLGVANSSIAVTFYDAMCGNKLYSGRRRWITQYVSQFPLPDPETPAAAELITHVKHLIGSPSSDFDRDVLDRLVNGAFAASERSGKSSDKLF